MSVNEHQRYDEITKLAGAYDQAVITLKRIGLAIPGSDSISTDEITAARALFGLAPDTPLDEAVLAEAEERSDLLGKADHGIWTRVMGSSEAMPRADVELLVEAATGEPSEFTSSWAIEDARAKANGHARTNPVLAARYERIAEGAPGFSRWVPFEAAARALGLSDAELGMWIHLGVVREHDHSDLHHPRVPRTEVIRLRPTALGEADLAAAAGA